MYKFTSHITNTKLVLIRRHVGDGSCSALVLMRQPTRGYPTYKKPEEVNKTPPPPKGTKWFFGLVGATVLTGVAVVYAKNSPQTRNWLETNVPWASDVVAVVYQENTTYWNFAVNKFNKYSTILGSFMFGKEGVTPVEIKTQAESNLNDKTVDLYANKEYELPKPKFAPLYTEEVVIGTPEVDGPATLIQTDKCEPVKPPKVKITKDVVQLEQEMLENTKMAIDQYKEATKQAAEYNKALFKIIESSYKDLDKKFFTNLQGAMASRNAGMKQAKEAFSKASCSIETLNRLIEGGIEAPPEEVAATARFIKKFRADLSDAEQGYRAELKRGVLADKYWNKVEAARKQYRDELRALFPGVDLDARRLELRGDTDLLLLYTMKQIQYLQNEIAEINSIRDLKINRAIECHDEKLIIEAKVEDLVKREKVEREREYQKKALEVQAEANRDLKEQLKKQVELQQEILHDRIKKKEAEMQAKLPRLVSEQLEGERLRYKQELAAAQGKLLAIEQTLKQRAKAESEARRSQSLWAAAEALLAATRRPHHRAQVHSELQALEKAGKDDRLVETVLRGIPQEVRDQGVATEKDLRDRFEQLEGTAAKVALVGKHGAGLPVYFLSWLQSKLMFSRFDSIPEDELDNKPTDFSKLDTFEIMQRAKYYMTRGELAHALRYVNLLQGAPRAAAAPWLDAARRHLEVRQAAEALMAHASVSGLLHL